MEITLEAIISFIGLFVGGGAGAFFTWRYQKKKAKAEAESAEIDAAKELQDMYQQMLIDAKADREDRKVQIAELRQERDHYKNDRNELRERLDRTDAKIRALQDEVAKNGRQIDILRPFICTALGCKLRERGVISGIEDNEQPKKPKKPAAKKKDIEPLEQDAL